MAFKQETQLKTDFNAITISLASPESIKRRSYGAVTKPDFRPHQRLGMSLR